MTHVVRHHLGTLHRTNDSSYSYQHARVSPSSTRGVAKAPASSTVENLTEQNSSQCYHTSPLHAVVGATLTNHYDAWSDHTTGHIHNGAECSPEGWSEGCWALEFHLFPGSRLSQETVGVWANGGEALKISDDSSQRRYALRCVTTHWMLATSPLWKGMVGPTRARIRNTSARY